MGVSGTGKTTLGERFASEINLPFYDADDFHPTANIEKMRSGVSLNDEDRAPWLDNMARHIVDWDKAGGAVLACSALKESYRQILNRNEGVSLKWIFIEADFDLLKERLSSRKGHFFNPALLKSQFETLEPPAYGIRVSAHDTLEEQLEELSRL